jgi:hypothetical protein
MYNSDESNNDSHDKDSRSRSDSKSSFISQNNSIDACPGFYFSLNSLIHSAIPSIKMKDLVSHFRNEQLVYNVETKCGVIFNLPDVLQCGMFGVSGIYQEFRGCMRLLESTIGLIRTQLMLNSSSKGLLFSQSTTDIIEIIEIFGRIKMVIKKLEEKNFKISYQ